MVLGDRCGGTDCAVSRCRETPDRDLRTHHVGASQSLRAPYCSKSQLHHHIRAKHVPQTPYNLNLEKIDQSYDLKRHEDVVLSHLSISRPSRIQWMSRDETRSTRSGGRSLESRAPCGNWTCAANGVDRNEYVGSQLTIRGACVA